MQGSISSTINYLQLILYKTLNNLPSSPIFSASDEEIWPDLLLSHIGIEGGGKSTYGGRIHASGYGNETDKGDDVGGGGGEYEGAAESESIHGGGG